MIQANKQNLVIPRYFYAPAAPLQDIRPVLTGFQEPDVDQSRCPSMWSADCAVQVPINVACRLCRPGAHQCGLRFAIRRKPWALWVQRP